MKAVGSYAKMVDDAAAWIEHGPTSAPAAAAPAADLPPPTSDATALAMPATAPSAAAPSFRLGPIDLSRYYTKTFASNCATFALMLVGVLMRALGVVAGTRWVLAAGVFGFAGGITNWLAVHMLFERVPGLYGSGVIPLRFVEIRETVKDTMMRTFFDSDYLDRYLRSKLGSLAHGDDAAALRAELERLLGSRAVESLVEAQLEALKARPEGMMLAMQGIEPRTLKPVVMAFIRGAAADLGPVLMSEVDLGALMPAARIRAEIDRLMATKLLELTPERVRALLEEVIRVHLGWLVVWGNVFGALIGLVSTALGYP